MSSRLKKLTFMCLICDGLVIAPILLRTYYFGDTVAVELSVETLRSTVDPFKSDPWDCGGITIEEVQAAIAENRFCLKYHSPVKWTGEGGLTRQEHIERVAFLAVHPSSHPIEIDVGVPALGSYCDYPLQDGHHRLAASIIRGDQLILANVSGQLDYAAELFGVDCAERDFHTTEA